MLGNIPEPLSNGLTAILPSAHQDGPPTSSGSTVGMSLRATIGKEKCRQKRRFILRREVQNELLESFEERFPYRPINDMFGGNGMSLARSQFVGKSCE
jgi:hypothetical protein